MRGHKNDPPWKPPSSSSSSSKQPQSIRRLRAATGANRNASNAMDLPRRSTRSGSAAAVNAVAGGSNNSSGRDYGHNHSSSYGLRRQDQQGHSSSNGGGGGYHQVSNSMPRIYTTNGAGGTQNSRNHGQFPLYSNSIYSSDNHMARSNSSNVSYSMPQFVRTYETQPAPMQLRNGPSTSNAYNNNNNNNNQHSYRSQPSSIGQQPNRSQPRGGASRAPDIQFIHLNSFAVLRELLRPRSTNAVMNTGRPERGHDYFLRSDVGELNNSIRVVIRFCIRSPDKRLQSDNLPKSFSLSVNSHSFQVKNKYLSQCYDISPRVIQERDTNEFSLHVHLDGVEKQPEHFYGVYLVKKLDHEKIYQDLIKRVQPIEKTVNMLKNIFKNVQVDDDIVTELDVNVSLLDPLTKKRMQEPIRAKTCKHLQCFDAKSFISANDITPRWRCPFCMEPVFVDDLYVDLHLLQILQTVSPDCTLVNLRIDGTWSEVNGNRTDAKPSTSSASKVHIKKEPTDDFPKSSSSQVQAVKRKNIECITIVDSDDEEPNETIEEEIVSNEPLIFNGAPEEPAEPEEMSDSDSDIEIIFDSREKAIDEDEDVPQPPAVKKFRHKIEDEDEPHVTLHEANGVASTPGDDSLGLGASHLADLLGDTACKSTEPQPTEPSGGQNGGSEVIRQEASTLGTSPITASQDPAPTQSSDIGTELERMDFYAWQKVIADGISSDSSASPETNSLLDQLVDEEVGMLFNQDDQPTPPPQQPAVCGAIDAPSSSSSVVFRTESVLRMGGPSHSSVVSSMPTTALSVSTSFVLPSAPRLTNEANNLEYPRPPALNYSKNFNYPTSSAAARAELPATFTGDMIRTPIIASVISNFDTPARPGVITTNTGAVLLPQTSMAYPGPRVFGGNYSYNIPQPQARPFPPQQTRISNLSNNITRVVRPSCFGMQQQQQQQQQSQPFALPPPAVQAAVARRQILSRLQPGQGGGGGVQLSDQQMFPQMPFLNSDQQRQLQQQQLRQVIRHGLLSQQQQLLQQQQPPQQLPYPPPQQQSQHQLLQQQQPRQQLPQRPQHQQSQHQLLQQQQPRQQLPQRPQQQQPGQQLPQLPQQQQPRQQLPQRPQQQQPQQHQLFQQQQHQLAQQQPQQQPQQQTGVALAAAAAAAAAGGGGGGGGSQVYYNRTNGTRNDLACSEAPVFEAIARNDYNQVGGGGGGGGDAGQSGLGATRRLSNLVHLTNNNNILARQHSFPANEPINSQAAATGAVANSLNRQMSLPNNEQLTDEAATNTSLYNSFIQFRRKQHMLLLQKQQLQLQQPQQRQVPQMQPQQHQAQSQQQIQQMQSQQQQQVQQQQQMQQRQQQQQQPSQDNMTLSSLLGPKSNQVVLSNRIDYQQQQQQQPQQYQQMRQQSPALAEVNALKDFLSKILTFAHQQPNDLGDVLRKLVQQLIESQISWNSFIQYVARHVKVPPKLPSSLAEALPQLRYLLLKRELQLEGIMPPKPTIRSIAGALPLGAMPADDHANGPGVVPSNRYSGVPRSPMLALSPLNSLSSMSNSPAGSTSSNFTSCQEPYDDNIINNNINYNNGE